MITRSAAADVVVPTCDRPLVSVITVTYGTGSIILDCIDALVATLSDVEFEIIVVDNPADGGMPPADRLRLATSGVHLVLPGQNTGFGGGNQLGVAAARGELICLLNPDLITQPGWWQPLHDAITDVSVGIAAPVLLDPDGTVQECGQTLDHRGNTAPVATVPEQAIVDVTYSSAACWVIRANTLHRSGGFDPRYYPAYFEDVDLALRIHELGLRTVVATGSRVVHRHGSSTRHAAPPAVAQQAIFRRRWAGHLATLTPAAASSTAASTADA